MHIDAFDWTKGCFHKWLQAENKALKVLEFGSLDINGSIRSIFEDYCDTYIGVDRQGGPGVDIVHDAESFTWSEKFDVVVVCEVFEHTPIWRDIITNSYNLLYHGGLFISTMAGEGRHPHSALDENPIREWEYYDNVGAWELSRHLKNLFSMHEVNTHGSDLRCMAVK